MNSNKQREIITSKYLNGKDSLSNFRSLKSSTLHCERPFSFVVCSFRLYIQSKKEHSMVQFSPKAKQPFSQRNKCGTDISYSQKRCLKILVASEPLKILENSFLRDYEMSWPISTILIPSRMSAFPHDKILPIGFKFLYYNSMKSWSLLSY